MSLLLLWICLNSYAQLPHPNDTLDNGKKVSFNQFLGRFSVFNELLGAGQWYSFNAAYSLLKTDLVWLDFSLGANRAPYGQGEFRKEEWDSFHIPVGLSAYLGRRRSRFNVRFGYQAKIYPAWFGEDPGPFPNCAGYCPTPPRHSLFLAIGYVFQYEYGFFTGIHAYGLMNFPFKQTNPAYRKPYYYPWAGLTFGYRLPSKQLHREWTERSFKKRILRLKQPKERKPKRKKEEEEDWFDETGELQVDSIEMAEIEARLAKLHKRHLRYQLQEKRENGRSHIFAEGFGAAGFWSVNYSYTFPVTKSELVALDFRGAVGADYNIKIPIHAGIKIMKNYRGTGVFAGVMPSIDWERNRVGAIYFLEHNVEFHFAYGLTGGVAFYLFFDPDQFEFNEEIAPYGGFFLGYRLPKMKKD